MVWDHGGAMAGVLSQGRVSEAMSNFISTK